MSNTLKLTVVATLFNVLFEYSLRGVNAFVARPFSSSSCLPPILPCL